MPRGILPWGFLYDGIFSSGHLLPKGLKSILLRLILARTRTTDILRHRHVNTDPDSLAPFITITPVPATLSSSWPIAALALFGLEAVELMFLNIGTSAPAPSKSKKVRPPNSSTPSVAVVLVPAALPSSWPEAARALSSNMLASAQSLRKVKTSKIVSRSALLLHLNLPGAMLRLPVVKNLHLFRSCLFFLYGGNLCNNTGLLLFYAHNAPIYFRHVLCQNQALIMIADTSPTCVQMQCDNNTGVFSMASDNTQNFRGVTECTKYNNVFDLARTPIAIRCNSKRIAASRRRYIAPIHSTLFPCNSREEC